MLYANIVYTIVSALQKRTSFFETVTGLEYEDSIEPNWA